MNWFLSAACGSGLHCAACRTNREFREGLVRAGKVAVVEFACPYGEEVEAGGGGLEADASLRAKSKRLWRELRRWREAGYQLVPREEQQCRLALCQNCEHYAPQGNWGLGKCRICGCTRAKLWLASAHCPHPGGARW